MSITIRREIEVKRKGLPVVIDVTYGTDLIQMDFKVTDCMIPAESAAVAYNQGRTAEVHKQICIIDENVISFTPEKGFFEEGRNELQLRVVHNNRSLFTFKCRVECQGSFADSDAEEVKRNSSLVEQLMTEQAVTKARLEEVLKLPEDGSDVEKAVNDIKVGAYGKVYSSPGEAVRQQISQVSKQINEINDITVGKYIYNVYDESKHIDGFYINEENGEVEVNNNYSYWDYMDISDIDTLYLSRSIESLSSTAFRYALYDEKKTFLRGGLNPNEMYDSNILRYVTELDTHDAKYIRISYTTENILENRKLCVGGSKLYVPYKTDSAKNEIKEEVMLTSVLKGKLPIVKADSLTNGQSLQTIVNNIQSDNTITFFANITNFERIDIGHYDNSENGIRIAVFNETLNYVANGNPSDVMYHNLTFKDYIYVRIDVKRNTEFTVTIKTNGGEYTRTDEWYNGFYGSTRVDCINASLTNCTLSQQAKDIKSNAWIFGDSYMSYDETRWSYYLGDDEKVFINAFAGAMTQDIYPVFDTLTDIYKPQYILWLLGMNNPDSPTEISGRWQVDTENFISKCLANGIEPILATIPNVPNLNHTFKNAYVRNSGLRYIDFATVVNANSVNATWYDGMLSDDDIHPSVEGAKALHCAVITDFTEIIN